MENDSIIHKILHFPLTRIIIGFLVVGLVYIITAVFFSGILSGEKMPVPIRSAIAGILSGVLALAVYRFLFKAYEQRRITELSSHHLVRNLGLGIALGIVLQTLTILMIYMQGGYEIKAIHKAFVLLTPLGMAVSSAFFEEVLFRGILFRIVEEKLGSWISLLLSAIIFGMMHFMNPNSSWLAGLAISVQAGLLLGAAYIYARNLWFPIAIHFAWNFTQGGIFGAFVSGNETTFSLFSAQFSGPDWLTGGAFGPEASMQATVLCLIAAVTLLWLSYTKGRFKKNRLFRGLDK